MDIFSILTLFGGLAMFLYGMRIMGDGLKESSSGKLKQAMDMVTNNPIKAFLLGLGVTALIQSSTATIVITSGLAGVGILNLHQSLGIILGANVGTTVTGQIIRLLDLDSGSGSVGILQFFKPSTLAPIALIIGIILIMANKKISNSAETIGGIAMGFGILFVGLLNMTDAVDSLNATGVFDNMFSLLGNNAILGYAVGAVVSFILQSSSATVGILQTFSMSGQLSFHAVYPVIVGIYLGDCLTTFIVGSIGAKTEARRVCLTNVIYNLCKSVLVLAVVFVLHQFGILDGIWDSTANPGSIANANTIFNLASAIIVLPFTGLLEQLTVRLVKEDEKEITETKYDEKLAGLNPAFAQTPALALKSCYDVLWMMFTASRKNIEKSLILLRNYNKDLHQEILEREDHIDQLADQLSGYLELLSSALHATNQVVILNQYYNDINEFERLGDYAENIAEIAADLNQKNITFSENAFRELDILEDLLSHILDQAGQSFLRSDLDAAKAIEPLEEVVDDIVEVLKEAHLKRLYNASCNVYSSTDFLELLSNLERVSDICSNIGLATITRRQPELTSQNHSYSWFIHSGKDEQFNLAYQTAHNEYFKKLDALLESDQK